MLKELRFLSFCLVVVQTLSFAPKQVPTLHGSESLFSTTQNDVISFNFEKPLGMILEEVVEGEPMGVYVIELADEGSATSFPEIVGLQLETVMNEDVSNLLFDDVMAKLVDAPSPVSISFLKKNGNADALSVGTPVTINVIDGDKEVTIEAKVGDNLRQVLLDNDFEVYKGLKQKLGNCGGAGQCGFCAVGVDGAWEPRSEYEDKKLKNSPESRLSCLNNIQGPANIKL
ncbi:unnamed protein product [Cylindrotheca closterium]|uniref:2Fe-2S ferredoxin-type domain-containing protein n=1 Tax=Cylindrotheca closterium TaxID=2856 RepID=A0AAD2CNY2_9STRA|nr:unnamed protein product [Cylindrotheca closterium]